MKKLSSIDEGLWDDIVRRGTTGEKRREDNVDELDMKEFYEYLKSTYTVSKDADHNINYSEIDKMISIPITRSNYGNEARVVLAGRYNERHFLRCNAHIPEAYPNILDGTDAHFTDSKGFAYIKSNDDEYSVSNSFVMRVIDTLLKNVKRPLMTKNVNEGLWDGIIRRGTTGENRKEDNVNSLGFNDFYTYLKKKYEDDFFIDLGIGCIVFTTEDRNIFGSIEFKDDKNRPIDNVSKLWLEMEFDRRDFELKILENFDIKCEGRYNDGSALVALVPKKGEMTNVHCIQILDIINEYRER